MIAQQAEIISVYQPYYRHLLRSKDLLLGSHGAVSTVRGYGEYNHLVKINSIWSNNPHGDPSDRTKQVITPLKTYPGRPWKYNSTTIDLTQAISSRVRSIEQNNQKINVMWSGGVDSTVVTNAFIAHLQQRDQMRVLYSPFSVYEHAPYLDFLRKLNIETVDMSGTTYLEQFFDGIFVTGDGGDECHASLDESFLERYGMSVLDLSWREFFWANCQDQQFMDFCEKYFSWAGREINTVLEARWWFYINSKYRCIMSDKLNFWLDYPSFNRDLVISFFDFDEFDRYISHHIGEIIRPDGYHTWKQYLKDFSMGIDGFDDYRRYKKKVSSFQLFWYANKKRSLKNLFSIFVLDDGSRISTPNMPLFSVRELYAKYGDQINNLWNAPDQV